MTMGDREWWVMVVRTIDALREQVNPVFRDLDVAEVLFRAREEGQNAEDLRAYMETLPKRVAEPPTVPAPAPVPPPVTPSVPPGFPQRPLWAGPNVTTVAYAIEALTARHVNLQGACGAFQITNLVALWLSPRFGLLLKHGGNRAVPSAEGCASGDEVGGDGYATDYLIDAETGEGYDILGDGGGSNTPQWSGPESNPDTLERNRKMIRPPVSWR